MLERTFWLYHLQLRNRLSDTRIWHLVFSPRILVILPVQFQTSETMFTVQLSCGLCHKLISELWILEQNMLMGSYWMQSLNLCGWLTWIQSIWVVLSLWKILFNKYNLNTWKTILQLLYKLFFIGESTMTKAGLKSCPWQLSRPWEEFWSAGCIRQTRLRCLRRRRCQRIHSTSFSIPSRSRPWRRMTNTNTFRLSWLPAYANYYCN